MNGERERRFIRRGAGSRRGVQGSGGLEGVQGVQAGVILQGTWFNHQNARDWIVCV